MMICNADFEELFPALFRPAPVSASAMPQPAPNASCIARWEDDGGRIAPSALPILVYASSTASQ